MTMQSAIQRLKDEYLIRIIDENKIEALHPVRAQIVLILSVYKLVRLRKI